MLRYTGPPMPATSANLRGMIGDETGTGALVFAESPTLVTPALGAASATSLTTPLLIGGTAADSALDLKSTSGNGTADYIRFLVGNNGAKEAMRIRTTGEVVIGTTTGASFGEVFKVQRLSDTDYSPATGIPNVIANLANTTSGALNNSFLAFQTEGGGELYFGAVQNAGNTGSDWCIKIWDGTDRVEKFRVTNEGNVGAGVTAFGTGAKGVIAVKNGTAPTTGPADTVQFYSTDDAAGHTIPSFYCEGTNVLATGQADIASSVRVKMRINGTVVTLLAI